MLAIMTSLVQVQIPAASVIDSPHTEANGISCSSCHSYSAWWQYSPLFAKDNSGDLADAVCNQCHSNAGPAFVKAGHSTSSMGAPHPEAGSWSTRCVDCHDPHTQQQVNWLPSSPVFNDGTLASGFFLVEGKMRAITDNDDGTTTFEYTNGLAKPRWEEAADWTMKSGHEGRGLILALGYGNAERTYEVTAASVSTVVPSILPATGTGTITVQTGSDPIPPKYEDSQFGLFYGQLVKNIIQTPHSGNRFVKFLDGKDGMVTTTATPRDGVCQVCHTVTKYWRNDGDADPGTGKLHNPTITCSACHRSETGFKPSGGPHTFLGESAACVLCHQSGDILGVHYNKCQNCHTSPPALANPDDKPLVVQIVRGTCLDCHGTGVHNSETAHDHRNALPLCASCHSIDSQVAIDTLHKKCDTCHVYTGSKLSVSEVAAAISTGKGLDGTDINCQTCHSVSVSLIHHSTAKAANNKCISCHASVNHSSMVKDSAVPVCLGCHTGTAGTETGIPINPADPKIHFSCRTCHTFDSEKRGILVNFTNRKGVNGNGQLPDGGTIGGSDGGGVCSGCHTESPQIFHHRNPHVAIGECEKCHIDPRPSRGNYQPGDNGGTSQYPTQLACRGCHVNFAADGVMTVKKYTRTNYNDLSTPWSQVTQHTIPGVIQGQINNYGICFSCHGEGTATKVRVFHGRPDQHDTNNSWALGSKNWRRRGESLGLDQAHYAAGRGSSGIGAFNYFSASYEAMLGNGLPTNDRPPNFDQFFQNWYTSYSSPRNLLYPYKSYWSAPYIIPIQATALNAYTYGSVIVLPAVTTQTIAGAVADSVTVDHAVYDGADLIVIARNIDGCNALTASYGGTNLSMFGSVNCTAIFTQANYPEDGTTVNVTTANDAGIHVVGYPIANQPGGVAVNDFYPAYSGIRKSMAVMNNDIGKNLSLQSVSEAGHGEVAIIGDTVSYTSTHGYSGDDSFSYTATDSNGKILQATVSLSVTINQAPIAGADAYTVVAGGEQVVFDVLTNDSDEDGDPLIITEITQPSAGSAVLDGTHILYTPPSVGYDGEVIFTYRISDGMSHVVTGEVTMTIATPRDWVTVLDAWQPTPQSSHAWQPSSWGADGYFHLLYGTKFTVSPGLNRLLVMSINVYTPNPAPGDKDPVIATYGGKILSKAFIAQTSTSTHNFISYLGYLTENDINTATGDEVAVAVSTGYNSVTVSLASYSNVNQNVPIAASSGNKYTTGAPSSPVINPVTAPIPVHAGQYAMYNRSTSSCGSGVTGSEGYTVDIDYIDHVYSVLYGVNVGLASKLITADNTTNPLLTEGNCSADGSSSLMILNNVSGASVTVDTDLDGVEESLDLCPGTQKAQSVNYHGCAQSQTPAPTVIALGASTYRVVENLTATITVSRTGSNLEAVAVNYATTNNGTATPISEYTPTSGTLTWDVGDMADKTFHIFTSGNQKFNNPDKTVGLVLSSPAGVTATLGDPSAAELTIVNSDPEPAVIAFNPTNFTVDENAGTAIITVSRTGSSSGTVDVTYSTREGSAHENQEYIPTSGTLHWDADDITDKTFSVTILDNDVFYPANKYLGIILSNPSNGAVLGSYDARFGDPLWAELTIIDNDVPATVSFSSPNYSINENDATGMATITVARTGSSIGEVWVYGETQIGALEYEYAWITLNWLDGDLADKTFSVPVNNDSVYAADKAIEMKLYFASNAILSQDSAILTIVNDEPFPSSTIAFSAASYSVNENNGTANIILSRTGVPTGVVCVSYAAQAGFTAMAGVDYNANPGTLCWADGDLADKTFDVSIVDNLYHGVDKTVALALNSPTGDVFLGSPNSAVLTIVDNDAPILDTSALTSATYSANENDGTATITVARFGNAPGPLSVGYATTEGGTATAGIDYVATSGTLSWADDDFADKTFNVTILDNTAYAGNKTLNVLTTATGNPNQAVLTIVDDESVIDFSSSTYSVNENGGTAVITARRTGSSKGEVRVVCTRGAGGTAYQYSDYLGPTYPQILYWADGDLNDKTITLTIIDDTLVEEDETEVLKLINPTGNATLGNNNTTVLTIIDNDDAALAFTASSFTVNETDTTATITVSRSGYSTGPVSVNYETTAGGSATVDVDYTATSGTLNWANSDMTDKSFTIPISYTADVTGNKTVNLTLSSPTGHATIQGVTNMAVLTIVEHVEDETIFVFSASAYSVLENGGTATITVKRVGSAANAVTVKYEVPFDAGSAKGGVSASGGSDYRSLYVTSPFGRLTWGAGDMTDKIFTVTIYDDLVHEGDETVNLELLLDDPPTPAWSLGIPSKAVLTIVDND